MKIYYDTDVAIAFLSKKPLDVNLFSYKQRFKNRLRKIDEQNKIKYTAVKL